MLLKGLGSSSDSTNGFNAIHERLLKGDNGDESVSDEDGADARPVSVKTKEYEGIRMDERAEVEEIKSNQFKAMQGLIRDKG